MPCNTLYATYLHKVFENKTQKLNSLPTKPASVIRHTTHNAFRGLPKWDIFCIEPASSRTGHEGTWGKCWTLWFDRHRGTTRVVCKALILFALNGKAFSFLSPSSTSYSVQSPYTIKSFYISPLFLLMYESNEPARHKRFLSDNPDNPFSVPIQAEAAPRQTRSWWPSRSSICVKNGHVLTRGSWRLFVGSCTARRGWLFVRRTLHWTACPPYLGLFSRLKSWR